MFKLAHGLWTRQDTHHFEMGWITDVLACQLISEVLLHGWVILGVTHVCLFWICNNAWVHVHFDHLIIVSLMQYISVFIMTLSF